MKNLIGIIFFSAVLCSSANAQFEDYKIVDLSYPFDENTIYWPTEEGFKLEVEFFGTTEKGYHYSANKFCTAEHGGTHIDAPIHFYAGRNTVDEVPLDKLFGKAVVIDCSDECGSDRDFRFSIKYFENWEKENGIIPEETIVLLKTGYGKYWNDREKYMGTNEHGIDAVAKLHFPGLHPQAAEWLVNERKIKAVGIESPSIDYGQSTLFESHVILGKNNVPILENVANLDKLPAKNFYVIALPMKIKGGSGGPTRIIAVVKN